MIDGAITQKRAFLDLSDRCAHFTVVQMSPKATREWSSDHFESIERLTMTSSGIFMAINIRPERSLGHLSASLVLPVND